MEFQADTEAKLLSGLSLTTNVSKLNLSNAESI
uniref:Uncharacterized protein n=1 Tax=Arundo donax TaxID=35708 RepID=A0A0A8Y8P2_ARUDO